MLKLRDSALEPLHLCSSRLPVRLPVQACPRFERWGTSFGTGLRVIEGAFQFRDPRLDILDLDGLRRVIQHAIGRPAVQPYYILMKLPGSDQLEYLLMTPFTPQKRNNMISWMAARCDFPEYGKMLFYQLPKEKLIYGPMQIEAMIDQNTTISQHLTLWDQRGSRVIRGNLIAVPIENSFLYVVPVYLTAAGTNFPQLKRVIVISGDKVAMEPTLDEAIQSVFGTQQPQKGAPARSGTPELGQARTQFDEAQKAMQQGDWEKFGKAMEALKRLLTGPAQ